ncbi:class I SAM-dependent methyltransferase [Mesorhizobium sp. M0954]|uniref:class I SAM-dependent methyltransferase n=1 Tax=Mesorhizobium sp. M0954 TaxID=2957032 RepID=UPI00333DA469
MLEKLKTVAWFAQRPVFWAQAAELTMRKTRPNRDGAALRAKATEWAAKRQSSVEDALRIVGLDVPASGIPKVDPNLLKEAEGRARASAVTMGGAGDLDLLHAAVSLSGAKAVVETGVAYGWSSLAILSALNGREGACLVSVDMPYAKRNNEPFVGIAVPDRLRSNWTLLREPDRNGLKKAVALHHAQIDLCHYDSDKSYYGRKFAYPILWESLEQGGIFISDDIQDNMCFAEFVQVIGYDFAVTHADGKFVGIMRKLR